MPTKGWTQIVIVAAAIVAFVIVWVTTGDTDIAFAKAIVTASTIIIVGLVVFDRWLWRYKPLRWLHGRPVLHGTWKIVLRTSHQMRAEEEIEAYLVVRQTYSSIRVDGLFDRSNSECLSADLAVQNGRCTLNYLFRSEASALHQDGNPPSRGAASLRVARQPTTHLEGDYWMQRGTKGSITSVGRSTRIYDTFNAARLGEFG
jgi:hypothetical protein